MFESGGVDEVPVPDLRALAARLGRAACSPRAQEVPDATRIDRIRALEDLKAAAAAAQAREAAELHASRVAGDGAGDDAVAGARSEVGAAARDLRRGVAAEIALARRESPHRGGRHLGLADALVAEMPHTFAALAVGRISEWRATILVRETAVLTAADRATVDAELAGDPAALATLEALGDRALAARATQVAYRVDPRSVVARASRAEGERCVTVRPAPDTMAYLTALLPVRDAVTAHTALARAADTARSTGDPRTRGQLMADTLVTTLATTLGSTLDSTVGSTLGTATGDPGVSARPGPEDVALRLVMTDRALLDGDDEPAHLDGYGTVPASWARALVASTLDPEVPDHPVVVPGPGRARRGDTVGVDPLDPLAVVVPPAARVFVKRLLTDAVGAVTAMDSRARLAPTSLAALVRTRDLGTCRTPWCDAPARHVDHVVPHARGGPTSAANSPGLCQACNLTKELAGWRARVRDRAPTPSRHTVTITTPTGHTYVSTAPLLPGSAPAPPGAPATSTSAAQSQSPVERWLAATLALVA